MDVYKHNSMKNKLLIVMYSLFHYALPLIAHDLGNTVESIDYILHPGATVLMEEVSHKVNLFSRPNVFSVTGEPKSGYLTCHKPYFKDSDDLRVLFKETKNGIETIYEGDKDSFLLFPKLLTKNLTWREFDPKDDKDRPATYTATKIDFTHEINGRTFDHCIELSINLDGEIDIEIYAPKLGLIEKQAFNSYGSFRLKAYTMSPKN